MSDKRLTLHPFGIFMLREFQSEAMKAGFHYSISGTKVGNFSRGPLGHPGDGEYDSRPISKFDVHSKYTKKDLTVKIESVTEVGTSGFQLFQKKPLPSWNFQVNFVVPRSEMKSFFGIDDFNYAYFESLLDACG
ncbi:hypothetical protein [Undibacterium flavidum]|uniref:Uncharacterized protein n=1 Tax=Undibacterium flavidum TaxID=2762297 RepID=A0ABR6YHI1_9BURK|nr:hypothetical protein [Undibacterium flavidum]MBC3876036.1 hypothetical protein [Undibacterium flavidum]